MIGSIIFYHHFQFQLPSTEEDQRISYFPKTKFTLNSTVFDITIDNFTYRDVGNGRIALELILINGQPVGRNSTRETSTVDDEYTPSVFRTWEYYFNEEDLPNRPYLQWKPISYQSQGRRSTKSQEANIVFPNCMVDYLGGLIPRSLASALFNESTSLNCTAMYIVFGTDGDQTFLNSPLQTW